MATYTEDPVSWYEDVVWYDYWDDKDKYDWDTTNPPIDILEGEEDYE